MIAQVEVPYLILLATSPFSKYTVAKSVKETKSSV
jgi:hypothetical protein